MKRSLFLILTIVLAISVAGCVKPNCSNQLIAKGLILEDPYTISGPKNFLKDYRPINPDGSINVVVEIPAGTNEKWEVNYRGDLQRGFKNLRSRTVDYLAYPANYGIVPRTIFLKEMGGDGEPMDVLLLGRAFPRGSVVSAKLIGMLKITDKGERDDKLIAVTGNSLIGELQSIHDLKQKYTGVMEILNIWFKNYKYRKGKVITIEGYAEADEAMNLLKKTVAEFDKISEIIQK